MVKGFRIFSTTILCFSVAVFLTCDIISDAGNSGGNNESDIVIAKSTLDGLTSLNPIEGIDTNAITMAQAVVDNEVSGVTVSIYDANGNANIANDGTITYDANNYVTGSVVFALNQGTEPEALSTVTVTIPKQKTLYDDFSSGTINSSRWLQLSVTIPNTYSIGVSGEICNLSLTSAAGYSVGTGIKIPTNTTTNAYKYLEMKGTLNTVFPATGAYAQLRVLGTFYSNAINSNVYVVVRLIDGPYGKNCSMAIFTVTTGGSSVLYGTLYIFDSITTETEYTMSISYDGDRTFTGSFNNSTHTMKGPARYGDPLTSTLPSGKQISLFIQGVSSAGSSISASVDDVHVR